MHIGTEELARNHIPCKQCGSLTLILENCQVPTKEERKWDSSEVEDRTRKKTIRTFVMFFSEPQLNCMNLGGLKVLDV